MWYIFETKKVDYSKYTVVNHDADGVGVCRDTGISLTSFDGACETIARFKDVEVDYVKNHSEYIGDGLYKVEL